MEERIISEWEWSQYDWIRVGPHSFIRGLKHVDPPEDGCKYIEVTTYGDKEQKWAKATTVSEKEMPNKKGQ